MATGERVSRMAESSHCACALLGSENCARPATGTIVAPATTRMHGQRPSPRVRSDDGSLRLARKVIRSKRVAMASPDTSIAASSAFAVQAPVARRMGCATRPPKPARAKAEAKPIMHGWMKATGFASAQPILRALHGENGKCLGACICGGYRARGDFSLRALQAKRLIACIMLCAKSQSHHCAKEVV